MKKISGTRTLVACGGVIAFALVLSQTSSVMAQTAVSKDASANTIGTKTRFVLDCYARVDKGGDATVFTDCFTPDYKMIGPETKMLSKEPDGSLRGEAALNAMGSMNRNDDASFGKKDWKPVMSMENDTTVVRRMRWTGKAPHGSYGGFENLPSDLTITGDAVLIDTFRDGKIAEQFYVYETMGFFMDLAQVT